MSLTSTTAKRSRNLISVVPIGVCVLLLSGNAVFAEPYLQLDAFPAVYVGGEEESVVSTQLDFTLYALVNSKKGETDGPFYISATLVQEIPVTDPTADLGSFLLDGDEVLVVSDMDNGTPPGMPPHGAYPTYYYEHQFTLDPDKRAALYNSQDDPGGPGPIDPDGPLYFEDFRVDARGLTTGLLLRFDLFTKDSDGTVLEKAPFSHDVLTSPIPGAVLLGMLGLGVAGLKLRRFA